MKKFVWSSDFHIGLHTEDISRTEEIIQVMFDIVDHAIKIKADGVIFGGDIFHNNNPSSHLIKLFLKVVNRLSRADIELWIMVGNHDIISDKEKKSCLELIKELEEHYVNVQLVSDIKCQRIFKAEVGNCYFTFLPHVSQSHISTKYKTIQAYVDKKSKKIIKKLPKDAQHFAFSHLNVKGAIPGSEDTMLKKSSVFLPEVFMKYHTNKARSPKIIQGHIHTRQEIGDVNIVGSPIFVDFGENEHSKYFLEIQIPEYMGEGSEKLIYHKTNCRNLLKHKFEINKVLDENGAVAKFITSFNDEKEEGDFDYRNTILKIDLTLKEEAMGFDHEKFRDKLSKHFYYVKSIIPRVVRNRITRNKNQTVKLAPRDAMRLWLKTNRPKNRKRKYKLGKRYMEKVL